MCHLAIIIVNYRTAKYVCDCLRSLQREIQKGRDHVYIVDNHSEDGSVQQINTFLVEEGWCDWVEVISLNRNAGFAAGNNAAIIEILKKTYPPEFVLLLNPDTLVLRGAIDALITFLQKNIMVGVVGAQLENEQRKSESSARRFPSFISECEKSARLGIFSRYLQNYRVPIPPQKESHPCDWVSGAAMMVRWQLFDIIGRLDENYFLYFEEVDFCKRVHRAGWEIWIEPLSRIVHLEGASTGINLSRRRRGKYWYDSRRRYFVKHHGVFYWIITDIFWFCGWVSCVIRNSLGGGCDMSSDPLNYARDLLGGDIKALISGNVFLIKKNGNF